MVTERVSEDVRATALLLDIGGVVLGPGPALVNRWGAADARVAAVLEEIGGIAGDRDELWRDMLAGRVSERTYWSARAEQIGAALGRNWSARDLMSQVYRGPAHRWLNQVTIDLMLDARQAKLRLGALTNDLGDFHGREWVDQQSWVGLFDVVVDASRTGVLKPDPRAFENGVAAMGCPASQIVYLDDMPWNVEGARLCGMQAVLVSHVDAGPAVAQARRRLGLVPATV